MRMFTLNFVFETWCWNFVDFFSRQNLVCKSIISFFLEIRRIYALLLLFGASLITQLIKKPPALQETPVRFLGWEDLLEKG